MKISTTFLPSPTDFKGFAERHDLAVEIVERDPSKAIKGCPPFYAQLMNAEIQVGMVLTSCIANGDSPQLALDELCRVISKQTVRITTPAQRVGSTKIHSNVRLLNLPLFKSFTLDKHLSDR